MASEGSLNPGWFGHPGSTLLYPLAALFRLRNQLESGGSLLGSAPRIEEEFTRDPTSFYLSARILSVLFALLTVWIVYLAGKEVFDRRAGILGAWFSVLCPLTVSHARLARPDSATAFFGMLALWACLRLYRRPGWGTQAAAGAAIGLAIATKYSLVPLLGVLVLTNIFIIIEGTRRPLRLGGQFAGGLVAVALVFILTTPFFLIEFSAAIDNIRFEMRSTHLGADGMSPLGNLLWYLGTAIPRNLDWPRPLLALATAAWALATLRRSLLLVLAYLLVLLAGISSSALHWERWIIPIVPAISLLAAGIIVKGADWVADRISRRTRYNAIGLAMAALAVSWAPARDVVRMNIRHSLPDTRMLAREWAAAHLPPGAVIAKEWYTAPLDGLSFRTVEVRALPLRSFEYYRLAEVRYFIAGRIMYRRYFAEPERYAAETAFYRRLFNEGFLLAEFSPSRTATGPTVRIYELDP